MFEMPSHEGASRQLLIGAAMRTYDRPFSFLEIGHDRGDLRRELREFFDATGNIYTAVDIIDQQSAGPITKYVQQDSVDFWRELPKEVTFDIVFVDGCHCTGHADLDTKGALLHLNIGGQFFIHDVGKGERNAGPADAWHQNCEGRPELETYLKPHIEGMGIAVKLKHMGRKFLLQTERKDVLFGGISRSGETIPSVREAFPLYFERKITL